MKEISDDDKHQAYHDFMRTHPNWNWRERPTARSYLYPKISARIEKFEEVKNIETPILTFNYVKDINHISPKTTLIRHRIMCGDTVVSEYIEEKMKSPA